MDAINFLKTIYVGDRYCKGIFIDSFNSKVKMQVNCISRVKGESWNYYNSEDVYDGFIVFNSVKSICFESDGYIPNDSINDIKAEKLTDDIAKYLVTVKVDSVDDNGKRTEVIIKIKADSVDIENPTCE